RRQCLAQDRLGPARRGREIRHCGRAAHLWRLDEAQSRRLEDEPARAFDPAHPAIRLHGKNATDGAMIIDAMDLLYSGRFDGFCIVSSDSDFARLAARLREQGVTVYGFGERKTPRPFVTACDKFIYLDLLRGGAEAPAKPAGKAAAKGKTAQ